MPLLSNTLRNEYKTLFATCAINLNRLPDIEAIVIKIDANAGRYKRIETETTVPWFFIAITHNMESGMNFNGHLHNGDPLTARTVQVPKNRPVSGNPPFTFQASAIDALHYKKFDTHTSWDLPQILYRFEKYNGFGYRDHHNIHSPYLWSGSNHYVKGKYVADGKFSATAVSKQIGAAVILRRLAERRLIQIQDDILTTKDFANLVKFNPSHFNQYALELQQYLNTLPGIYLLPDGKAGEKTSEAFEKIFGKYLDGDPRWNV
jgi:lysozyme family protein